MSIDPLYLWQHVLKILSNELNNDMSFNTVLKPTRLTALDGNTAVVEVPNNFTKSVMEKRYLNLIKDILSSVLKQNINVVLKINPQGFDAETVSFDNFSINDVPEVKSLIDETAPSLNHKVPLILLWSATVTALHTQRLKR